MTRESSFWEWKLSLLDKIIYYFRVRQIKKKLNFDNKTIVDAGSGKNAILLQYIKKKYNPKKLIAFDISLNKNLLDRIWINHIEGNLEWNFSFNEEVDIILCTAVLEHLSNPESFLKNAFKNLKKWWCLVLTVPSIRSKPVLELLAYKLQIINKEEILDHKQYYDKKLLIKYLNNAGFETIKHHYFELYMNNFILAKK